MDYICLACDTIIRGGNVCPRCGTVSTTPRVEEIDDDESSTSAAAARGGSGWLTRKRGTETRVPERGLAPSTPLRRTRHSAAEEHYALLYTLGYCRLDPLGGDGAYASWLHRFFRANRSDQGCVAVGGLLLPGTAPTASDDLAAERFLGACQASFREFCRRDEVAPTDVIILNWHVRFTGRPNAQTGRGISANTIRWLQETAREEGKLLAIVYTIHEYTRLLEHLIEPRALVALNPSVQLGLTRDFPPPMEVERSRVPGLMTTLHTSCVDRILRYVGEFAEPVPPPGSSARAREEWSRRRRLFEESRRTAGACLLQELRLRNPALRAAPASTGIAIFGMITTRHGTTTGNVEALCAALDRAHLPASLRVVVAGKTQDRGLQRDLRALSGHCPRLVFLGEIETLDALSSCRYAISFDPAGFRENASAMVNVTRAGCVLFSRINEWESDPALIARAVGWIEQCEQRQPDPRQSGLFILHSAAQQQRYRETSGEVVGAELDRFFRRVARSRRAVADTEASAAPSSSSSSSGSSSSSSWGGE